MIELKNITKTYQMGKAGVRTLSDGWTIVTRDRKPSAHFEHTIAITKNGPNILTSGK